ncbi:MAG TPA: sigma 54-interacting transcriptional regulator, partial [Pyrinomonadaceae bacterium]|nr:sigma 54-interacting transcriptional regulator [Pyrinomonadaceae bacterium]
MENVLNLPQNIPHLLRQGQADAREMSALLEIGQTLADSPHLRPAMSRALELLGRALGVTRGFVMLLDPETEEMHVGAAYGLDEDAARRVVYRAGEGVVGHVAETGKPVVVPQASREPQLLRRLAGRERTPVRQELSFVCVPLLVGRRAVGVLGVDLPYAEGRDYERLTRLLALVASMVAQALKVERLAETERARLADENAHLKQELRERYDFSHIVGSSNPMRQVYEQVTQVARTNTTVLLRGESGTGKEMVAHAIHYNSLRAGKPFVRVNCAALPETLIESELFGYEKGAFTGAMARKKGRFELADGGTLFLDEIGDLNASTQIKLLRAIQEREFGRLGGTETISVNVRLIAATNKDLEAAIQSGEFREDLYYRLNVFNIFMPPLRERKPDILLLADHFLEKYGREHGKHI